MTHAILAVTALLLATACGVKGPPVRHVDTTRSGESIEVETGGEPAEEEQEKATQ